MSIISPLFCKAYKFSINLLSSQICFQKSLVKVRINFCSYSLFELNRLYLNNFHFLFERNKSEVFLLQTFSQSNSSDVLLKRKKNKMYRLVSHRRVKE